MLPGIIPVGVTVPVFSYKEGYAGSLASGGSTTISLTTRASQYRWIVVSAGCGQSSSNAANPISMIINGVSVTGVSAYSNQDPNGVGSASTFHAPVRLYEGNSFTLSLSNTLGATMFYTVAVFEIPILNLQYVGASGVYGAPPYIASGPAYQGGLVIASFIGQGGSGTWSDITFTGATKVPAASSGQEALAYIYPAVNGTFTLSSTNNAAYNRLILVSSWKPA